MLDKNQLKNILHRKDLNRKDKILIILAVDIIKPKSVSKILEIAEGAGARQIKNWNVSDLLRRTDGLAIRTEKGWELNSSGKEYLAKHCLLSCPIVVTVNNALRSKVVKIKDRNTIIFVEEAISCFEHGLYRSAVVLSWVGAVALLYNYIIKHHLLVFNTEASRRDSKWKIAKTTDDLARMKEFDFLEVIEAISVIGKNVKEELQNCLKLRNGCGHPSSLKIAEYRVASHIEILILNVFSKF